MNVQEVLLRRILYLTRERGMTVNALAFSAGVSRSTIKNICYGNSGNTGLRTIAKLCDGLGISLAEFFDCDEFRTQMQEIC